MTLSKKLNKLLVSDQLVLLRLAREVAGEISTEEIGYVLVIKMQALIPIFRLKRMTRLLLTTPMAKVSQSQKYLEKKLEPKRPENLKKRKPGLLKENSKKKSERRTKKYRRNGELNI